MNGTDRTVLVELENDGPLSHDELCDRVGVDWDEFQSSIRRLRTNNKVSITIDRRYVRTDTNQ